MPREGKAKVLTEEEFKRVLKIVSTHPHAKRNAALLYFSFGLGLRAKEDGGAEHRTRGEYRGPVIGRN